MLYDHLHKVHRIAKFIKTENRIVISRAWGVDRESGLSFPIPGAPPNPGIKPAFAALSSGFFTTVPPGKPILHHNGL